MTEQNTTEGREAVSVEIAGESHALRFEMREIALLARAFRGCDPRSLIQQVCRYDLIDGQELWSIGDDWAFQACLWACMRRGKPYHNLTDEQISMELDDLASKLERHIELGGKLATIAVAVWEAWFAGSVGRKVLEEAKKKVTPPSPKESESTSGRGSDDASLTPAAAA